MIKVIAPPNEAIIVFPSFMSETIPAIKPAKEPKNKSISLNLI